MVLCGFASGSAVPQILLKSVHLYLQQDKQDEAKQILKHAYSLYPC